jgi:hypothetical protein
MFIHSHAVSSLSISSPPQLLLPPARGEGQQQPLEEITMNDQQEPREQTRTSEQTTAAAERWQPTQEELERLYLEQQRRLACPSCGDAPFLG